MTDQELWKRLLELSKNPLDPDYPVELLDEAIRAAGGDPEQIGKEGAAFVEALRRNLRDNSSERK